MEKENIDWGYYLNQVGGCENCMKACDEDRSCDAVECGNGYCSWWKNRQCLNPDILTSDYEDSTQTCIKKGILEKKLYVVCFLIHQYLYSIC